MKSFSRYALSFVLALLPTLSLNSAPQPNASLPQVTRQDEKTQEPQLSAVAVQQIESILQEKKNRTPEQRKIDPQLLLEAKKQGGQAVAENIRTLKTDIAVDDKGRVLVEIRGEVTGSLTRAIQRLNGEIESSVPEEKTTRARLPLSVLESLASLPEIDYIAPAPMPELDRNAARPFARRPVLMPKPGQPDPAARRASSKARIAAALASLKNAKARQEGDAVVTGPPFSQGDSAHQANVVRNAFGVDGTGVNIGVISDSVDFLAQSQASGNAPRDVVVVPGQSGVPGSGEGTAMIEIIYDVAPGAKLFFATANGGESNFAANIRRLRFLYRCDIIVDDVRYVTEPPFQDGIVGRAVNDVIADGAMYFASAGNAGNLYDGTGGIWEGDFKDGGRLSTLPEANEYRVHDFGDGLISNRIRASGGQGYAVFWSDPMGASSNDYDLFLFDSTLTVLKGASTRDQIGRQDPFEFISASLATTGDRIVVAKYGNAETRALHVSTNRGQFAISTNGQARGHSYAAGAYAVSAVAAAVARGGAFVGGPTNPLETFTSDGPRRIFYNPDGTPVTPGKILFSNGGGTLRRKPDITAADGVSTSVPGFSSFFGTSAAAPHAAALAALLKSAAPQMNNDQLRELITRTALDALVPGWDPVSGSGIMMPLPAYLAIKPSPLVDFESFQVIPAEGDGDQFIEPGENATLKIILKNNGTAGATNVKAKVTTTTPGVTMLIDEADFWPISDGKAELNLTPLRFRLNPNAVCGAVVNFTATVTSAQTLPRSFNFSVQTGQLKLTTYSYTGPPVAIPDGNSTGITIRVPISGLTGNIGKVAFRIDGDDCSRADGAGVQHPYVSDLTMRLVSPTGTSVSLMSLPGGINNDGRNFCNLLLDDAGLASIQSIGPLGLPPLGPPYTGTLRPNAPLSTFNGQNPNGTWSLVVTDSFTPDVGTVRKFSILIYTYDCR